MPPNTRSTGKASKYPPLLPDESPTTPAQPYYSPQLNLHPTNHDRHPVSDDDDDDDDDEDDESLLDGVPHMPLVGGDDTTGPPNAFDDNDSDVSEESSGRLLKAFESDQLVSGDLGEGRRGPSRRTGPGRGRGRGRGSLKALLEFEARKRGEPLPTSSTQKSRGRGVPRAFPRGEAPRGGGKGTRRGPRNAAEPTEDFKNLQALATNAFLAEDYDTALVHARKAVLINPEIFAAHSLLSEIFLAMGKTQESLEVLWSGAHTKREPGVWWEVANRTAELSLDDEAKHDDNLLYCYSRISMINKADLGARRGRLSIYLKRESIRNAIRECRAILKVMPYDLNILQILAEISHQAFEIPKAIQAYDRAIQHLQLMPLDSAISSFTFSELNIFLELFAQSEEYASGLVKLKSVARWLCGRKPETFWDDYQADDREWDVSHEPRRLQVPEFMDGNYPLSAYGIGLPVEIRAKMGIFRLLLGPPGFDEAMHHFNIIRSGCQTSRDPMVEYQDLLREIADTLFSRQHFSEALSIYESLVNAHGVLDTDLRLRMAVAYKRQNMNNLAKCLYEDLEKEDPDNPLYLVALAKICEEDGENDKAMDYVSRVIGLGRRDILRRVKLNSHPRPAEEDNFDDDDQDEFDMSGLGSRKSKTKQTTTMRRAIPDVVLYKAHDRLKQLTPLMRADNEAASEEWMVLAETLMEDFKNMAIFFPTDRYIRFFGYDPESRRTALAAKPGRPYIEAEAIAERLLGSEAGYQTPKTSVHYENGVPVQIPQEYRNIRFEAWLDIFCEYALCAARAGRNRDCYAALETTTRANVFYHNDTRLFHIHVCLFTCAIILDDEENMCQAARWVMKNFPSATNGYRLYAALHRLYSGDLNWYHSGPSQKFIMRQIKMIDLAILGDSSEQSNRFGYEAHDKHRAEAMKASSYQPNMNTNDSGNESTNGVSHDPVLLTLYGHMLATNGSYRNALNYYFRAYAVDPGNVMVVLSIATAYLQLAMKRQTTNRHYNILQAVSMLDEYKRLRLASIEARNHQELEPAQQQEIRHNREMEVEFNEGRLWHMLGLNHLAIAAYERCLAMPSRDNTWNEASMDEDTIMGDPSSHEPEPDFKREAAFALQQIFAISGDLEKAQIITQEYLVF